MLRSVLLRALLGLLALAAPAAAQTQITSLPYTISSPGKYVLAYNIRANLSSGAAITITSPMYVDLDLGGNLIENATYPTSSAWAPTIGISAPNAWLVTIHNGMVRGFGTGLDLPNIEYVTVSDLFVGNCQRGVNLRGSAVTVQNCRFFSTYAPTGYNAYAIYAVGQDLRIKDNDIYSVTTASSTSNAIGIEVNSYVGSPTYGVVENNRVALENNAVYAYGIHVGNASSMNVTGNQIFNVNTGIWNSGTGSVKCGGNLFTGVTTAMTGVTDIGNNH